MFEVPLSRGGIRKYALVTAVQGRFQSARASRPRTRVRTSSLPSELHVIVVHFTATRDAGIPGRWRNRADNASRSQTSSAWPFAAEGLPNATAIRRPVGFAK